MMLVDEKIKILDKAEKEVGTNIWALLRNRQIYNLIMGWADKHRDISPIGLEEFRLQLKLFQKYHTEKLRLLEFRNKK